MTYFPLIYLDLEDRLSLANGRLRIQTVQFMLMQSALGIVNGHLLGINCGSRSRWEGTYRGTKGTTAAGPGCAWGNCTCAAANAESSDYSAVYKEFLSDFYIAQVQSLVNDRNLMDLV